MNLKALLIRLKGPGDLYVVPPADSLAGLRIIQERIVVIDVVLSRKIAGIGCCPVLVQRLAYFLIFHAAVLVGHLQAFYRSDGFPSRNQTTLAAALLLHEGLDQHHGVIDPM
jgi:hypothetical protein